MPLSRFKVLDLTLARAGPSCVRTLADWGADVIRVEPPPEAGETSEVVGRRDGSDFQNLHRNKRAITLNLKTDEGREIFMRLAEKADVIVENMRPSVAKRLGVDFNSVKKRNPRIVYGSISGFGQYGPYAERPSIDQIAQGMTGIMSVTGFPGQGPLRVGVAVNDIMAGSFLAQGILIALLDREVSRRRPLGADLAAGSRHHADGFPGDALDHGQEGAAAGRQQPSDQHADGPVPDRRRLPQPCRHRQQEFCNALQADRPGESGRRSALCHARRCGHETGPRSTN